jgi:hypothetical protein
MAPCVLVSSPVLRMGPCLVLPGAGSQTQHEPARRKQTPGVLQVTRGDRFFFATCAVYIVHHLFDLPVFEGGEKRGKGIAG